MRRLRVSKIRSRVLLHVPVIVLYFSIAPRYTVGKPISAALMCSTLALLIIIIIMWQTNCTKYISFVPRVNLMDICRKHGLQ